MAEIDDRRLDIIIALLGRLVASSTEGDEVLALNSAGLRPNEIARILDMKQNAVSMRIKRAKGRERKK
jgi:DNA-directed RNA polymerase specialized sigma24 family protein